MTFHLHFLGGPLDGMVLEGDACSAADDWNDLGAIIFRETDNGKVGCLFELFNPFLLFQETLPKAFWLHIYQVTSHAPGELGRPINISAAYVGPSNRAIAVSGEAMQKRAQH